VPACGAALAARLARSGPSGARRAAGEPGLARGNSLPGPRPTSHRPGQRGLMRPGGQTEHSSGGRAAGVSDAMLVARAQQGDEHALRVLLERHQALLDGEVGRYFYLPGGDREDTTQEARIAFAAAVRCYRGGRGSSFRSFAKLCVARRLASALTAARRNKHSLVTDALGGEEAERVWTALPDRDDPVDLALAREQLREFRPAVATLSRLERDVLAHTLAGWSSSDAARRLGRSAKAADNALQRARRKLARSKRRSAA
jgi:RNA polymerase sigma-H factor